jgi:hypothetical protein
MSTSMGRRSYVYGVKGLHLWDEGAIPMGRKVYVCGVVSDLRLSA